MTTQTAKNIGLMGENLACQMLIKRGYAILERNVSCRYGEIDIVAEKEGKIHFCEVRLRTNLTFGTPEETVNSKKLKRLRKAIEYYWQHHPYHAWQVDIIAIIGKKESKISPSRITPSKITWYKDISL